MSVQSISLQVPKVKKRKWGKPKPGESLKVGKFSSAIMALISLNVRSLFVIIVLKCFPSLQDTNREMNAINIRNRSFELNLFK